MKISNIKYDLKRVRRVRVLYIVSCEWISIKVHFSDIIIHIKCIITTLLIIMLTVWFTNVNDFYKQEIDTNKRVVLNVM